MSTPAAASARRTALVTGASSGVGLAVARLLADGGHRVVGTSRDPGRIASADRVGGLEYRALDLDDLDGVASFAAGLLRDGVGAERVARTVLRAIEADAPAPTYAVGSGAPGAFALRRALPATVASA